MKYGNDRSDLAGATTRSNAAAAPQLEKRILATGHEGRSDE